jgi:photosystem II stability/assembly factor-like uncharacterized protein
LLFALLSLLFAGPALAQQEPFRPAESTPWATQQMMLASDHAGERIVAVGERGVILLSEDGRNFRQAKSVPLSATLTTVHFVDRRRGWAAGHWGAILKTEDGGETWAIQRSDTSVDQPIFSLLFRNERDGIAVGLWSLLLVTHDGGITWESQNLPPPPGRKSIDLNLTGLFASGNGTLFVTAEGGKLLRSEDAGASWAIVETGYGGTFWTGLALRDGTLLIGGLRGTVFRSTDDGRSWRQADSGTHSSITGFAQAADGAVSASALDGVLLHSGDAGVTFQASQRGDREALTALIAQGDGVVVFSKHGPLQP